jgi:large subunit ribosomal protein L24
MNKKSTNQQKRFAPKLHVKKGDRVRVIAGSYRGAEGEVLEVLPEKNRAVVENVNMVKKHTKASNDNPGGINEVPAPLHLSNLMVIDPKTGEPTRIGRKVVDGKRVRYSKKSGEIIK